MRHVSILLVSLVLAVSAPFASAGDLLGEVVLTRDGHVLNKKERKQVIGQIKEIEKGCAKFLGTTDKSQTVTSAERHSYGSCVRKFLHKYPELHEIHIHFRESR